MAASSALAFSTGLQSGWSFRAALLAALGAEDEWVLGDFNDESVAWIAGPLATTFAVEPSEAATPRLSVLHVRTEIVHVEDLAAAKLAMSDLNMHTTLNRWIIQGDADMPSYPHGPEGVGPPVLALNATFVVGDESIEFPLDVARFIVSEQIAKATALVTNDFADGIGQPALVALKGQPRLGSDWSRVVYFYDDVIAPHRGAGHERLLEALRNAFEAECDAQLREGPGWYGNADASGLTMAVPSGPGPYPPWIGMRSATGDTSAETETSLVRCFPVHNPYIGDGLLLTMSLMGGHLSRLAPGTAELLNNQSHLRQLQDNEPLSVALLGFAHGLGAWIEHQDEIKYACMIPSAWAVHLPADQLVATFRQLLANCARLSWGSRYVIDAGRYIPAVPAALDTHVPGLAAGALARGRHFGEPGVGIDPGASVLGFAWDHLVGGDFEWAEDLDEDLGFIFHTGAGNVRFSSRQCLCSSGDGALVEIATPLGRDTPELRRAVTASWGEGQPFGIAVENGYLVARSQLHAHGDTSWFTSNWSVPIAVAHCLFFASLGSFDRGLDQRHANGSLRVDRDQILELWDPRGEWRSTNVAQARPDGLLHALLFSSEPGFDAWFEGNEFISHWSTVIADDDADWAIHSLKSRLEYVEHSTYGPSLRINTELPWPDDQDVYGLNTEMSNSGPTILGGFVELDGMLSLVTLTPIALDRSYDYEGQISFAGSALEAHRAVTHWFSEASGIGIGSELSAERLVQGIERLVSTYRAKGDLPTDFEMHAESQGDFVDVTWKRPWLTSRFGSLPALSSLLTDDDGQWMAGGIRIYVDRVDFSSTRIIHAVLAANAMPNPTKFNDRVQMPNLAQWPSYTSILTALNTTVESSGLEISDAGEAIVTARNGSPIATLEIEDDPSGGLDRGVHITVRLLSQSPVNLQPSPLEVSRFNVGSWPIDETGVYRISLPPAMLVCLAPSHTTVLLWLLAEAAVDTVRAAVDGLD